MVRTVPEYSWGSFNEAFVDELCDWIEGRTVLEVFAGNGLLAKKLRDRGVDIVATTTFQGHDFHDRGMHTNVEELTALEAVAKYGPTRDILLMSWPVATEHASGACVSWGEDKPIVFIGEVTDLKKNQLGGCASDSFFEITKVTHEFRSYETARSAIEHASVRQVLPGAREIVLQAVEQTYAQFKNFLTAR